MKKRIFSMLLVVCMVFTLFPISAFATGNVSIGTSSVVDSKTPAVCENHKEHDETCGYMEAVDGAPCSHLNEDGTYSCAPVLDSGVSGNEATPSDADKEYVCDHSDDCGYVESIDGADCTHQCELCKPAEEITPPAVKDCDCTVKCTLADEENGIEESLNADCPVCSVDGADLAACKGEAVMAMIMPLSTLTDLSDAVSGGTVSNSTKITATAASGNKLYYEFSDLLVSGAYDMVVNIDNPNLTAVISGADISAKAGRFLVVYEVEATSNKLRGFACVKLEGKYYTDDTPNGKRITTALDFTTDSGNTPPADCTAAAIGHTHSDPADKCFTWDDGTDTLTLNNLNLETTEAIAIKLPADTTVNMGAADSISTVKSTFSGGNITYGIYGAGALDFSGNGTLTTTGGTATSNSYGVYTNSGNIVVSGGTK